MAEYRGDRVKKLREQDGMSQDELSAAAGVSRLSIGNYERGVRKPDVDTLIKIAETFHVSTDYLLGISDTKKPENSDIAERLGLSEKAIKILENKYRIDKKNAFTFTLNNLIEEQDLIRLIGEYLYGEIDESFEIPPYVTRFKYSDGGLHEIDSTEDFEYMEPDEKVEIFDDEKYRKITALRIQETLAELLKKENATEDTKE